MFDKIRKWLIRRLGGDLPLSVARKSMSDIAADDMRKECDDLSRQEILDVLCHCVRSSPESKSWFMLWYAQQSRVKVLKSLLNDKYQNPRDAGHMIHFRDLEAKVKKLKHEVTNLREIAEYRNKQMAAVKYIVTCTGCEAGGPTNKDTITEEEVRDVEQIAKRLRMWWQIAKSRRQREARPLPDAPQGETQAAG